MKVGYGTHVGKIRKMNQDAYWIGQTPQKEPVLAVADGLGGHRAGEVASKMMVDAIAEYATSGHWENGMQVKSGWIKTIKKANFDIFQAGSLRVERAGMGTTMTMLMQRDRMLYGFHVGDTRLYQVREGILKRLTKDHSMVEQLLDVGEITLEEAKIHPNRNMLMRAIGTDETVEPDVLEVEWKPGDVYLLCSDGLTNYMEEDEILRILLHMKDEATGVQQLIEGANARGGGDNITAIIFIPEVNG